jgi:hypothetical protein
MCPHQPACPAAGAADCDAAHVVVAHPEQGWSLLCNGVVLFEDTGGLLPDSRVLAPRDRPVFTSPDRVHTVRRKTVSGHGTCIAGNPTGQPASGHERVRGAPAAA